MIETAAHKRILVIGCGSSGRRHSGILREMGVARLGVCELDDELRRKLQKEVAPDFCFRNIAEVRWGEFDGAVIAVPAHLHLALAGSCLEHRVPFLMEKPIAASLDGTDSLIEAVARQRLPARVAYQRRHSLATLAQAQHVLRCCLQILAGNQR